jgi:hypothetical protein
VSPPLLRPGCRTRGRNLVREASDTGTRDEESILLANGEAMIGTHAAHVNMTFVVSSEARSRVAAPSRVAVALRHAGLDGALPGDGSCPMTQPRRRSRAGRPSEGRWTRLARSVSKGGPHSAWIARLQACGETCGETLRAPEKPSHERDGGCEGLGPARRGNVRNPAVRMPNAWE